MTKNEYELSVWEDRLDSSSGAGSITEVKLGIIGSDTMTAQFRATNIQLTQNINGSNTLNFSMRYYYIDNETGEKVINPFSALMKNERKIKLHWQGEWYDFLIKNIEENSDGSIFNYTCVDLFINELSKNGFNLVFDNELENNQGTIYELCEKVMEGTDWELEDEPESASECQKETNEEWGYEINLSNTSLQIYDVSGETLLTLSNKFLLPYSKISNLAAGDSGFIGIMSPQDGASWVFDSSDTNLVVTDKSTYTKIECTNIEEVNNDKTITLKIYQQNTEGSKEYANPVELTIVSNYLKYKGEFYVFSQYSKFDSVVDKYVLGWEGTSESEPDPGTVYSFSNTIYNKSGNNVVNLFVNSKDYTSLSGWYSKSDLCPNLKVEYHTDANSTLQKSYIRYTSQTQRSPDYEKIYNLGNQSNASYIPFDGIDKNDEYFFKIKLREVTSSSGKEIPGNYVTAANFNLVFKIEEENEYWEEITYSSSDEEWNSASTYTVGSRVKVSSDEKSYYCIKENTNVEPVPANEYFTSLGKTAEHQVSGDNYITYILTASQKITKEKFINADMSLSSSLLNDYYIEDIQFYKKIDYYWEKIAYGNYDPYSDSESYAVGDLVIIAGYTDAAYQAIRAVSGVHPWSAERCYTPSSVEYESTIEVKEYYYWQGNYSSIDDITFYQKSNFTSLVPMAPKFLFSGETEEKQVACAKIRTLTAKESNRFNILQSLAETFECWIRFDVVHNANTGVIISKNYYIEEQNTTNTGLVFSYGIDLKSIQRNILSEDIVTKTIVKDNENEYATDGFCSITRASQNYSKENFILNLDYYINQGLIDGAVLNKDLYYNDIIPILITGEETATEGNIYLTRTNTTSSIVYEIAEVKLGQSVTGYYKLNLDDATTGNESGMAYYPLLHKINTLYFKYTDDIADLKTQLDETTPAKETTSTLIKQEQSELLTKKSELMNRTETTLYENSVWETVSSTEYDALFGISGYSDLSYSVGDQTFYYSNSLGEYKYYECIAATTATHCNTPYEVFCWDLVKVIQSGSEDTFDKEYTEWVSSTTYSVGDYVQCTVTVTVGSEEYTYYYYFLAKYINTGVNPLSEGQAYTNDTIYWRPITEEQLPSYESPQIYSDTEGYYYHTGSEVSEKRLNYVCISSDDKYYFKIKDTITSANKAKGIYPLTNALDVAKNIMSSYTTVTSIINDITILNNQIAENQAKYEVYAQQEEEYTEKLENMEDYQDFVLSELNVVHKRFYNKYYRFIQEGTWNSEDYMDDNLYYLDGLSVAYDSSRPRVEYNISVLRLNALEDFKNKKFEVGQLAYIEDTEFFGWVDKERITPYKEEIVISEITYDLEEPWNDSIKVQNYKTQFEDLFQRITAETQSLQYASGTYQKAADIVNTDGTISSYVLQNSIAANANLVFSSTHELVYQDETGIRLTDSTDTSKQLKITSGGILISTDGGNTWKTGFTGNGINSEYLTSGTIDVNNIIIRDGSAIGFKWDSTGINAYSNNNGNVNSNKFVRMDQFGIYGVNGSDDGNNFLPNTEDDIWNNSYAKFGLTWKGFFLRSASKTGKMEFSDENDISIYSLSSGNYIPRIKIGKLDNTTSPLYGIKISNDAGNAVMQTDSNGNLWISNLLKVGDLTNLKAVIGNIPADTSSRVKIGYDETNTTSYLHDGAHLVISAGNKSTSSSDTPFKVYEDGYIEATGGKIGNMTIQEIEQATYKVNITSSSGTSFRNKTGSTTLTAKLYRGNTEVTSGLNYAWYKNDSSISHSQSSLTLDDMEEVFDTTQVVVYKCEISLNSDTYINFITLVNVNDGEDANEFRIDPNQPEIFKFVSTEGETKTYTYAPDPLQFQVYDGDELVTLNNNYVVKVNFNTSIATDYYLTDDITIGGVNNTLATLKKFVDSVPENVLTYGKRLITTWEGGDNEYFIFESGMKTTTGVTMEYAVDAAGTGGWHSEGSLTNNDLYLRYSYGSSGSQVTSQAIKFRESTTALLDISSYNIYTKVRIDSLLQSYEGNIIIYFYNNDNIMYISAIPLKFATSDALATFALNADSIVSAVANNRLIFDGNGITFSKKDGNDIVKLLYADDLGNLTLKGTVYADSGSFSGEIFAKGGTIGGFNIFYEVNEDGEVTASYLQSSGGNIKLDGKDGTGKIGGFNIGRNTLTSIKTDDDLNPLISLDGQNGTVFAKNLTIGNGASIEDYITVGEDAIIYNPNNHEHLFIKSGDIELYNTGLLELGNITFNGSEDAEHSISGDNWWIDEDEACFNNVIISGKIKATTYEYESTQVAGGQMIFKTGYHVKTIEADEETGYYNIYLDENEISQCTVNGWIVLNGESGTYYSNNYKISAVDLDNKYITIESSEDISGTQYSDIIILNKYVDNTYIEDFVLGINGTSESSSLLYGSGITLRQLDTDASGPTMSPKIINTNFYLGDLKKIKESYSGFGLYADNVILEGSLVSELTSGGTTYSTGINTSSTISIGNENIIIWGGAENGDLTNAPFYVTDKGTVKASKITIDGATVTNSELEAPVLKTAKIISNEEGSPLKIYSLQDAINIYKFHNDPSDEENPYLQIGIDGFTLYNNPFIKFEQGTNDCYVNYIGKNLKLSNELEVNKFKFTYSDTYGELNYDSQKSSINFAEGAIYLKTSGASRVEVKDNDVYLNVAKSRVRGDLKLGENGVTMEYQSVSNGYDLFVKEATV